MDHVVLWAGGRSRLFQVFGWDGVCQQGADAIQEGVGALAGVAGIGFVELHCHLVVCDLT